MAAVPEKIGRYKVIERVGRGGMGVLYRGVDPVLEREVAIKLMLADFSEDEEQMRPRFYREARAVAKLQHRNIVTVFEFGEEGNTPYIVMEFLRGHSLAAGSAVETLTLDTKLDVVAQLCRGLHYAHTQGIVHRDVKPANIFVLEDGTVKLLDFGIAKLTTSTLTRQGDVLGSASYMSPEQVSGSDAIDGRADIFSTGVVLYELLAGRRPFVGDSPTAIIVKILHENPPSLASLVPNVPPPLVTLVERALSKNPKDRFETAGEMARQLQSIRATTSTVQTTGNQTGLTGLDETRFASTQVIREFQRDISRKTSAVPAGLPKPDVTRDAGPARSTWWVAAGAAALIVVAATFAVATRGRGVAPTGVPATEASPAKTSPATRALSVTPAPSARPAPSVTSTPSVTLAPSATHTPVASRAPGGSAGNAAGIAVTSKAKPESAGVVHVSISGPYAFEVQEGGKVISQASESHDLSVPSGRTLRLVAPEYLLSEPIHIDAAAGKHLELEAPALGKLTILTNHETCSVRINGRDLGYPPIRNQSIAAGTYKIDLLCPNGQNQVGSVVVAPGQLATSRIF